MMKNFYYLLGVNPDCTFDEIREAYRKLSKKFHPDLNTGDRYFETRFEEINEAYHILSDPDERRQYDKEQQKIRAGSQMVLSPGEYNQATSGTSTIGNQKRRGPGIGMSVALLITVLVFATYVVISISPSKKTVIKSDPVPDNVSATTIHKHHKKKSIHKTVPVPGFPDPDVIKVNPKPATAVEWHPVKENNPAPDAIVSKPPAAANNSQSTYNGNYLYTTYLRSNATGVINMRSADYYNAEITQRIPANSKVYVIAREGDYYKVAFNNNVGYVPKWCVLER